MKINGIKISTEEQIKNYLIAHGNKVSKTHEPLRFVVIENGKTVIKEGNQPKQIKAHQDKRTRPDRKRKCDADGMGDISCTVFERKMCKAHIITQKFNSIRSVNENILWICKDHEIYFNTQDIKIWFAFVKEKYPKKFNFVKSEYEYILNEYKEFLRVALS